MNNQKEIHCKIFLITVYSGTRNQLLNVGTKIIKIKELKYTSVYITQGSSSQTSRGKWKTNYQKRLLATNTCNLGGW